MSADHRKPVVAFVVLAFLAAALVGVQRADAQAGGFMAAVLGGDVHAQGRLRATETPDQPGASALPEALTLAPGGSTAPAAPQSATPDARRARVSRGHDRHDLSAADRHPTRGPSFGPVPAREAGPADQAADQARAAVSKPMPEQARAKGRASSGGERRPETSGPTR